MDESDEIPRRQAIDLSEIATVRAARPSALDVRAIRRRLGFTQAQFAGCFGLAVAMLRHWERGNRQPSGTALVLLHVIAHHPRAVLLAARKARAALLVGRLLFVAPFVQRLEHFVSVRRLL